MPQLYCYYVSYIIQSAEGRIGLAARPVNFEEPINSPEAIGALIAYLIEEHFPDGSPDLPEGLSPIVPLTWQVITAKRGEKVKLPNPRRAPVRAD
ncbi:MAG: hypothetical protein GWN58_16775 [Anaerolineae bacterium]|nr:hypothetical protein [Anaerolineae bacterium]